MRVISGSARRLTLKSLPGNDTRPTTDMIKETLFNMINFDIPGRTFLDLFAGTGAIGIEALSRGADSCVFVDNNPAAVNIIRENVAHTGFEAVSEILTADAAAAVRRLAGSGKKAFGIIFLDPPYNRGLEDAPLSALLSCGLADEDSIIIVEMSRESDISKFEALGYSVEKEKIYKTNKHVFLRRK